MRNRKELEVLKSEIHTLIDSILTGEVTAISDTIDRIRQAFVNRMLQLKDSEIDFNYDILEKVKAELFTIKSILTEALGELKEPTDNIMELLERTNNNEN